MYRTAASRVRALKSQTGYRGSARYATISAVAAKSSSGGFFSWLTGDQCSSLPSLNFPLKDVNLPLHCRTMLSLDRLRSPHFQMVSRLPLKQQRPASYGATHLLERMAFKSTTNRSHLRIIREIEAIGGNVTALGSREHMSYTYDALKTYVPQMVELLIDCVRNPAFLDWEVKEQLQKVSADINGSFRDPHQLLLEAIHSTGYSGPYANDLFALESAVNCLNSTVLEEFVAEHYTASRMVLAASGVDHDKLLEYAEPLLSDLPNVSRPTEPKPIYTGGDFRRQGDSGITHFALAFELHGGWLKEKDAIILTVLQMLMGGGGSFSAGGPGKGMYSRLYLRVLNEHPQIQSFSAFNSIYNHTGLFGIQATTESDFAIDAIDIAVKELIALATPGQVDKVELNRAKESTKSAILMNLESRMVVSEDIGKQILTYGERTPLGHFLKVVDEITKQDIAKTAQKLFHLPSPWHLTAMCFICQATIQSAGGSIQSEVILVRMAL
ncbi:UNVERIFIED_CONTAM: Mitochondrial-processing peptidase subunit alpha [Sesamum calycinum]|uniref:Mitochondrial-processing peptidase subunit alpha n=1 Tax=Sesamum calycinum TaxID=2727403 RepID=A0AAW2N3G0_9LAMI